MFGIFRKLKFPVLALLFWFFVPSLIHATPENIKINNKSKKSGKAIIVVNNATDMSGKLYLQHCSIFPRKVIRKYFVKYHFVVQQEDQIEFGPRMYEKLKHVDNHKSVIEGASKAGDPWVYLPRENRTVPMKNVSSSKISKLFQSVVSQLCK